MSCTNLSTNPSVNLDFQRHLRDGCTFRMREGIVHMYFNGEAYFLASRHLHGAPAWSPNADVTDALKRGEEPSTIWYEGKIVWSSPL